MTTVADQPRAVAYLRESTEDEADARRLFELASAEGAVAERHATSIRQGTPKLPPNPRSRSTTTADPTEYLHPTPKLRMALARCGTAISA